MLRSFLIYLKGYSSIKGKIKWYSVFSHTPLPNLTTGNNQYQIARMMVIFYFKN